MATDDTKTGVAPQSTGGALASGFPQFLLKSGAIDEAALHRFEEYAAEHSGENLDIGNFFLEGKLIDEEKLAQAKAEFYGLPYVDLREVSVAAEILATIPQESVGFYRFVPFALEGQNLKVAIAEPENFQALQALEFLGQKQGLQIDLSIASNSSIGSVLGNAGGMTSVVDTALDEFKRVQDIDLPKAAAGASAIQVLESAPIVKIVDVILTNAIEAGASDIHLEPSETEVRVRYRIDGVLHNSLVLPRHAHAAVVSRIKILANLKIDETRLPQDGRFHFAARQHSVDLRVSILPLIYGEKIVMRILDKSSTVPTLEELGLRFEPLTWVNGDINKSHGIFLITGPTGSGKSTTLYSILSMLNTADVNIVTLEDPVEYFISGVNQSQINPDIGLTFATGLRSILRQDPNVVMVGEIRDRETAELAVHAALTGHLIFSTLHTNNAVGAIPRLVDMDIEPFLLAASVNMIIAQRLVRRLCTKCKMAVKLPPPVEQSLREELKAITSKTALENIDTNNLQVYRGQGCGECDQSGFRGRLGIFEVLRVSNRVQDMILTKTSNTALNELAVSEGMMSMRQDGIIKVIQGETSYEEVVRVTSE